MRPPNPQTEPLEKSCSAAARQRMFAAPLDPIFFSGWRRVVFIHFEVDPVVLQKEVPFPLDLHEGKAYVSLVAFHLEKMRPRFGGKVAAFCVKPVASHEFLNIRTYVRNGNETGIYFLAEYLPNRISLCLGRPLYGLPYRYGKLSYHHRLSDNRVYGHVTDGKNELDYEADDCDSPYSESEAGTLEEFLFERYTAFTHRNGLNRFFRIWHPPWWKQTISVRLKKTALLETTGNWFGSARMIGAQHSPGFENVWMGRPHFFK